MKISTIQMNIEFGDPESNYQTVERLIREAASEDPDFIILPEMWNSAYDLTHLEDLADVDGERTTGFLKSLSKELQVAIHGGSVAVKRGSNFYNTTYITDSTGEIIHVYDKIHLFQLMNEHHYLAPGTVAESFEIQSECMATMTCYDLRFPELSRHFALKDAKVLFIPAQWPSKRLQHWRILLQARAIENQMYVVAVNRIGADPDNDFPGHSMIIDPWGEVLYEGTEQEEIQMTEIDLSRVEEVRKIVPIFEDRIPTRYKLD